MTLEIGDKVKVIDPGLMRLAAIMGQEPQNKGWVAEIWDDGDILVKFPIGDDDPDEHSQVAPYPRDQVVRHEW